jgi:hypothetical protein
MEVIGQVDPMAACPLIHTDWKPACSGYGNKKNQPWPSSASNPSHPAQRMSDWVVPITAVYLPTFVHCHITTNGGASSILFLKVKIRPLS